MSFILDALRKSEHARQRQTGPALAEVPIVAVRPKTNVWATAAVALLVVNLLVVGVLLLRRAQRDPAPPAVAGAAASIPAAAGATPRTAGVAATAPGAPRPAVAVDPSVPMTQPPPGSVLPEPALAAAPPPGGSGNPLAAEVSGAPPGIDASFAARASSVPDGPPAVTAVPAARRGSVVYAPLPDAADSTYASSATGQGPEPAGAALPTADEIVARGGVPPLHLDLHVYSTVSAERFIFVNSHKYKQGETLQEGPVVEEITRDGAVLDFRGSRFTLSHD